MTAGIVAVVVILVGLPLLAWWVGGRRFWGTLRPAAEADLYREMVLKHRLSPSEISEVQNALGFGRALSDERLRAVVVDWGQRILSDREQKRRRHPVRWRITAVLVLLWGASVPVAIALKLAAGNWAQAVMQLVWFGSLVTVLVLLGKSPRRAIERNSGPVRQP